MTDWPVRVILVDDHKMVLDAMAAAMRRREGIEIVGLADSTEQALELLDTTTASVVVTDFELGDGRGTDLVTRASQLDPPVPVLLITGTDDLRGIEAALASGCAGFVSKSQGMDQLVEAVMAVARGAAVFPAALFSRARGSDLDASARSGLSSRELEVLNLLAGARTLTEIAASLHLSQHTIRNHIKQILLKLGAHSQLEAVVIGVRSGLIEIA